eukprot:scaffold5297_cov374-Prasinococcus_capsulatus_cf.AAC.5
MVDAGSRWNYLEPGTGRSCPGSGDAWLRARNGLHYAFLCESADAGIHEEAVVNLRQTFASDACHDFLRNHPRRDSIHQGHLRLHSCHSPKHPALQSRSRQDSLALGSLLICSGVSGGDQVFQTRITFGIRFCLGNSLPECMQSGRR